MHEVFTPMSPSEHAYIARRDEARLAGALAVPGRQVLIHGQTGAGKTTMTVRTLGRLGMRSVFTGCRRKGELIDAAAAAEALHGPPATPPSAGGVAEIVAWLAGNGLVWVLEDVHKLPVPAQHQVVEVMQGLGGARVVALGTAPGIAGDEVLGAALERIPLQPMDSGELDRMLAAGADKLNVDIPAWMRREIIEHANAHPAICHQFALTLCLEAGVHRRVPQRLTIPDDAFARAHARTPQTLI